MKIPKHAKRVFKGIIFDVYHWQQKMFDGTTATYEGLKRADSVNVLPVVGGKIWVGRQEQPGLPAFWGLFGGRADGGEEPMVTAKRELKEETGLASDDWELIDTFDFSTTKIEWQSYFFVARSCRKVQEPEHEPGERIEIKEVSFDEFMKLILRNDFRDKEVTLTLCRMKEQGKLGELKSKLFK